MTSPLLPSSTSMLAHLPTPYTPRTPALSSTAGTPQVLELAQDPPTFRDPSLPDPAAFDIIPALQELLSRLLLVSQAPVTGVSEIFPTKEGEVHGDGTASMRGLNGINGSNTTLGSGPSLDIQNLSTEIAAIRDKIKRARAAVESCEGAEYTMSEIEQEIGRLRGRCESLRRTLGEA